MTGIKQDSFRSTCTKSAFVTLLLLLPAALALAGCKAAVTVSDIQITPEKPVAGDKIKIEAQAENTGLFAGNVDIVLMIDGEEADSQSLNLEPKSPQSFDFSVKKLKAGKHTLVINGAEQEFTVLKPASFRVTEIFVMQQPVIAGEMTRVKATVRNDGEVEGEFSGDFTVDGTTAKACKATVGPESETVVDADIKIDGKGEHTIELSGQSCKVRALAPATYEPVVTVEPAELMVGGTFKVHVVVRNTGEIKGDYSEWLKVDGKDAQKFEAAIEPGGQAAFDAELKAPERGNHAVSLGELKTTVKVKAPASIAVDDIELTDEEVMTGEAVTATVWLENSGDVAGKFTVQLLVNGKAAATKEVTVEPGLQEVEFLVTQKTGGVYRFKCGNKEIALTVRQITRPATGTLLVKAANGGYCSVTISNGNEDEDGLFIFSSTSNPSKPLLMVYVRAGEKTKKIKIKNGTYSIYYSVGTDFDIGSKQFLTDAYFRKFDQTMPCSGSRSRWTDYTLEIYATSGNASTSPVDEDDFPH